MTKPSLRAVRRSLPPSLALVALALTAAVPACGSSDSGTNDEPGSAGTGGATSGAAGGTTHAGTGGVTSGGAGKSGGPAGTGGGAGKGGGTTSSGGGAGKGGGTTSAGGSAGNGSAGNGSAGNGSAGNGSAGNGSAGKGGAPATGGAAGQGAGGMPSMSSCGNDVDCVPLLPVTVPASCASAVCDPTSHACTFDAKDADGDGHATNHCTSTNPNLPIKVGDDCDDADSKTFPGAWDGPAGDGHPDACDQIDQDCDGSADDGALASGATCTCTPGDKANCSQLANGQPITWPTGAPTGVCAYGSKACLPNGTWGPCGDAITPGSESCNHLDDDCNGIVDDGPPPDNVPADALFYVYDGDDDDHSGLKSLGYPKVHVCSFDIPTTAPEACTQLPVPCALGADAATCCPPNGWKLAAGVPQDDCDDQNGSVFPTAPENCATVYDDNCDGNANEGCKCSPTDPPAQCSATSTGTAIVWPAGVPVGSCSYGSSQCQSNGQPGACNGAMPPGNQDSCAVKGNDDNCNGVANEGCACIAQVSDPSYQSTCSATAQGNTIAWPGGHPQGACKYGTALCQESGTYGTCTGAIAPKDHDSCTIANDDSDCNGTPNTGCTCLDIPGDPSYTSNCSETSNGNPITWPTGSPKGACQYGTAQCDQSGQYGTCVGAVQPIAMDDCSKMPGVDSNCDGKVSCNCVANTTTTTVCNQNGSCHNATATCAPDGSAYSACTILPKAQDTCVAGNDDNCNGAPNEGCAHVNGSACGDASTCNAGATWGGCQPNGTGCACSTSPASPAPGTLCTYGNGVGACAQGGFEACTGTSSGSVACSTPRTADVGTSSTGSDWPQSPTSWNDSYDWSCDGVIQEQFPSATYTNEFSQGDPSDLFGCVSKLNGNGSNGDFDKICATKTTSGTCFSFISPVRYRYICDTPKAIIGGKLPNYCGDYMGTFSCSWNGSTCVRNSASLTTIQPEGCH